MAAVAQQAEEKAEMKAEAALQEAEAQAQEARGIQIDVDLDNNNNMEWEVETEPADDPEPDYVQEEQYEQSTPYVQDPLYSDDYYNHGTRVARRYNKHIFTWLFSYLLGIFGVDRFARGQVMLGLLKMLSFGGFGFWYLADLTIAIIKSYSAGYRDMDDLLFDYSGRYIL